MRATMSGRLLAGTWRLLGWDVTFNGVAAAMLAAEPADRRGGPQSSDREPALARHRDRLPRGRGRTASVLRRRVIGAGKKRLFCDTVGVHGVSLD